LDGALAYLVVVVVVGVLAAIAVTFYTPTAARAYLAVAESDLHFLVSAIDAYKEHTGSLPATLADLTAPVTNQQGKAAGPFINRILEPSPWGRLSKYRYRRGTDGTFSVCTYSRDVKSPGRDTMCRLREERSSP